MTERTSPWRFREAVVDRFPWRAGREPPRVPTKLELTRDGANTAALAEFRKLAVWSVEAPPPVPFATQAEWRARRGTEEDDGPHAAWPYACHLT